MEEKEFKVEGMTCMHCVNTVKRALSGVEGVSEVEVFLDTGKVKVKLEKEVPFENLRNAIEEWGYKVVE